MPGTAAAAVSAASHAAAQGVQAVGGASAVSGASQAPQTWLGLLLGAAEYLVTVPMVYFAVAFMAVAVARKLVGMFRSPPQPFQLAVYPARKSAFLSALGESVLMPQVLRKSPGFWVSLVVFHAGLLLLFLGHLDILPGVNIMPPQSRHMIGAGIVGLMVTVPALLFFARRFMGARRQISLPSDYLLLLLLLATFLLGDLMSWGNSWTASGFVMTKQDFAKYFDSLARFTFADPRSVLHGSHYHFVVLHVLLANLVFMTVPFSKIIHAFLAVPVNAVRRAVWKRG